jgi:hypothetical protein
VTGSIFLATLAVDQKSMTIRFCTAAEMLERFGMSPSSDLSNIRGGDGLEVA